MKLLFIRHAQSTGNQQKRMQGHADFELSSEGINQATKLAQRLLQDFWRPTWIYSSPLKRAVQTTEILMAYALTKPLRIDSEVASTGNEPHRDLVATVEFADELKEFQNGIFEGLTWAEAKEIYPDLCNALEASPDWIQIPGAESLQDARDRAHRFIQTLLTRHADDEQIWIVTHSWILQHLIAELLGCDRSWRLHPHNTALFEFWIDHARWHRPDHNRFNTDLWQIRRFNDCRHLDNL